MACLRSWLFFIPTILSIFNAVYIGVLVSAILLLNSLGVSEIELVTWWVLIGLIVEVPLTSLFWYYARKYVKFSFPIYNVVKYIGATLVFFIVYFFTSDSIIKYEISIYKFLPSLLLQLAICVGVYLAITYVIDKNTKLLFKSIIKEIFKKN